MIDTFIFDLDGTLIDSMNIWKEVDYEFLKKRNIELPDNLFDDFNKGNSFAEIAVYFKKKFKLDESIDDIMNEWNEMVEDKYKNEIVLKKGVYKFLKTYFSKYKFGLGTSNNIKLTKLALKKNGISDFFREIITGCDVDCGKPNPEIFLLLAEKLNSIPSRCLVFEDTLVGVKAAKNANMNVVALYDKNSKQDFNSIKKVADYFFYGFNELLDNMEMILSLNRI